MVSNKSLAINQHDLVMISSSILTTVISLTHLNYCTRSKAGKKNDPSSYVPSSFQVSLANRRKTLRVTPEPMPQCSREQKQRAETTSSWRAKEGKSNYLGH